MSDVLRNQIVDKLTAGDPETWSQFLFNIDIAKQIKTIEKDVGLAILASGVNWSGAGWTTGSASKRLWDLLKIPLVVTDFTEYLHLWLFTLSMAWEIEVPALTLSPPAADAAFHLLELLTDVPEKMEADHTEDVPPEGLAWEDHPEDLPAELQYLVQKASQGDRLDLAEILKDIPKFSGLPTKAPENNHRQTRQDKDLKAIQQSLLHGLRLLTHAYCCDSDVPAPWQMSWKHLADT